MVIASPSKYRNPSGSIFADCTAPGGVSQRNLFFLTSLTPYILASLLFQKRRRPSRSGGDCCEKGVPSSGEKIVPGKNSNAGRRWRRGQRVVGLLLVHSVPARSALCHRVAQRHGESRSGPFLPLNTRQPVGRSAN